MNEDGGNWAFKPGDIFYQYVVIRALGAGLHGEVYLVEHRLTHDRFALKVMHLEDVREASRVRRALSTALASYRIQHANVVTVHDIGCEEDGKVWVRMEYLDGGSIGELLSRQRGRVSLQLAFHIAIEAAWAIDAAHEMQIIHRDLKPENVWLTAASIVKVIDFSLAKVIPDGVPTTQRKTGFGTAPYMAPEALKGPVADARVDVYALGMMLWQMLAGRHPWQEVLRNTTEMIRRQLHVLPPALSSITRLPPYVDDFMQRALAKDPAARFRTMAEMARAMMTLRDRLREDAEGGVFDTEVPPGEPRLPGEPWAAHTYHGTHELAEPAPEPAMPSARIVLAATQPLPKGFGGTLPLAAPRPAQVAAAPPPAPLPQHAVPAHAPVPVSAPDAPAPRAMPPSRDTAMAVMRGEPRESAPALPSPWSRTVLVALAVVSVLVTGLSMVAWRYARGAGKTQAVSASATVPPASASVPETSSSSAPPPALASSTPIEASSAPTTAPSAPVMPTSAPTAGPTTEPTATARRAAPASPPRAAATPPSRAWAHPAPPPPPVAKAPEPPAPAADTARKPARNRLFGTEP